MQQKIKSFFRLVDYETEHKYYLLPRLYFKANKKNCKNDREKGGLFEIKLPMLRCYDMIGQKKTHERRKHFLYLQADQRCLNLRCFCWNYHWEELASCSSETITA